jgi:ABC-type transport system involved in Fe-S cluster assembly fused permease/ATPase subunit
MNVPQVGRTTIIIAHRLATVCKANKIAAVYRGRVLEQVGRRIAMCLAASQPLNAFTLRFAKLCREHMMS